MAQAVKKTIVKKAVKKVVKKSAKKVVKKPLKKNAAKKKKDALMCFLTSACVDFYGLNDKGYELNTLRHYRDSYLAQSKTGKKLIQKYYELSPKIVSCVNNDFHKDERYAYIYSQVHFACEEIEKKHFMKAKNIYKGMVSKLLKTYSLI